MLSTIQKAKSKQIVDYPSHNLAVSRVGCVLECVSHACVSKAQLVHLHNLKPCLEQDDRASLVNLQAGIDSLGSTPLYLNLLFKCD